MKERPEELKVILGAGCLATTLVLVLNVIIFGGAIWLGVVILRAMGVIE